ncbi:hypothetical protein J6590_028355 [Homalodisca vitripennis]|nr:hypothetical protein J6590_028355 [Homalodisca vitripennis]
MIRGIGSESCPRPGDRPIKPKRRPTQGKSGSGQLGLIIFSFNLAALYVRGALFWPDMTGSLVTGVLSAARRHFASPGLNLINASF